MAYLKPPFFVRSIFNRLAMWTGMSGTSTLAVAGRTTGESQRIPVIPFDHEGARYVVSTRGEAEWVRNLREAGTVELTRKGNSERFAATEVPTEEREPILAAYREVAGRTVDTYFKQLPDPADHPTFRLEPGSG